MRAFTITSLWSTVLVCRMMPLAYGWIPPSSHSHCSQRSNKDCNHYIPSYSKPIVDEIDVPKTNLLDRRDMLSRVAVIAPFVNSLFPHLPAYADDSNTGVAKPKEFKDVGTQAPPPDGSAPFVTLTNGVKVKDFKIGAGEGTVGPTSRVDIQCSGRLLNLNGVVFYNTKNNNPDGFGPVPLTIELGKNQAIPGLEAGVIGMKKGGIRRIIVPQELAYNAFPDLQPKPLNANDQRALDSVVKNPRRDGAILFDVQVERFK